MKKVNGEYTEVDYNKRTVLGKIASKLFPLNTLRRPVINFHNDALEQTLRMHESTYRMVAARNANVFFWASLLILDRIKENGG